MFLALVAAADAGPRDDFLTCLNAKVDTGPNDYDCSSLVHHCMPEPYAPANKKNTRGWSNDGVELDPEDVAVDDDQGQQPVAAHRLRQRVVHGRGRGDDAGRGVVGKHHLLLPVLVSHELGRGHLEPPAHVVTDRPCRGSAAARARPVFDLGEVFDGRQVVQLGEVASALVLATPAGLLRLLFLAGFGLGKGLGLLDDPGWKRERKLVRIDDALGLGTAQLPLQQLDLAFQSLGYLVGDLESRAQFLVFAPDGRKFGIAGLEGGFQRLNFGDRIHAFG